MQIDERTPLLTRAACRSDRSGHGARRLGEARALHDQTGVMAFAGAGAIYARQFFSGWVVAPERAVVTLALQATAAVATATVGRYASRGLLQNPSERSWRRALPWALATARLAACPLGEAPAMAASLALHIGLAACAPPSRAQTALAWSIYAAYLVGREAAFTLLAGLDRKIMPVLSEDDALDTCNGLAAICTKRWCDAVFPATHNAAAISVPFAHLPPPLNQVGRFASNQDLSLERQVHDGIRGFLLEYYRAPNGLLMSSHNTVWNFEPLERTFSRLHDLVQHRPRDMLVLQLSPQGAFEIEGMRAMVQDALDSSGLARFMRADARPALRPNLGGGGLPCDETVGDLLANDVRVVAYETGYYQSFYSGRHVRDITCDWLTPFVHGNNVAPVTLNAFTSYAFRPASDAVNQRLAEIYARCQKQLGPEIFRPTLLAVNHYESSSVVALARALNANDTLPTPARISAAGVADFVSYALVLLGLFWVLRLSVLRGAGVRRRTCLPAEP